MSANPKLLAEMHEMLMDSADRELFSDDWSLPGVKTFLTALERLAPDWQVPSWLDHLMATDAELYVSQWVDKARLVAEPSDEPPTSKAAQVAALRGALLASLETMLVDIEGFSVPVADSNWKTLERVRGSAVLRTAASLLGPRHRNRYIEEWTSHLTSIVQ